MAVLELVDVGLEQGSRPIVEGLSLRLEADEVLCLLGPSGSGKTTVLRAIAGLHPLAAGALVLRGRTIATPARALPPEQRALGFVFQDLALFPHLSARAQVEVALHRRPRAERARRADAWLAELELHEFADRYPQQLSGGQQQRLALARALACSEDLILLDEPFSSLDAPLRAALLPKVRAILRRHRTAAIVVTHDQAEALALGDRVGILAGGRLRQLDRPETIYRRPADPMVAEFIGEGGWLLAEHRDGCWSSALGPLDLDPALAPRARCWLRPEQLELSANGITAEVLSDEFRGAERRLRVRLAPGCELSVRAAGTAAGRPGEQVRVRLLDRAPQAFPLP